VYFSTNNLKKNSSLYDFFLPSNAILKFLTNIAMESNAKTSLWGRIRIEHQFYYAE